MHVCTIGLFNFEDKKFRGFLMMGHYTYEGPIQVLCKERVQISRYAADHGVAIF